MRAPVGKPPTLSVVDDRRLLDAGLLLPQLPAAPGETDQLVSEVALVNHRRRKQAEDDLRVYRNLLALLPYAVRVRTVLLPPEKPPPLSSVVYFRPGAARAGRHLGWS